MSRTSLFRPRRPRAVRHRPATDTRLLSIPYPRLDHSLGWGIPLALSEVEACPEPRRRGSQERNGRALLPSPPQPNSNYKRCPKALRLRLRSDQSPSRPLNGRSPDKPRHALSRGHCQVRAPLTRRKGFAPSGDAPEHGVIVLPRAIAPLPDSPAAALGEADLLSGGRESTLPFLRMVEHFWWSRPHREISSRLLHILSEVRGCRRAVTDVEPPLRRTPPIGTMAGHFWWSRPPHSETSSLLFHILPEVRGCRRVVADVKRPQGRTPRIATGVADIMRNRPGPSTPFFSIIPSPVGVPLVGTLPGVGLLVLSLSKHVLSLVEGYERGLAHTRPSRHSSHPRPAYALIPSLHPSNEPNPIPVPSLSVIPFLPPSMELEAEVGVTTPTSASVLLSRSSPRHSPPRKKQFSRKQSKITPELAHQSKLPLPTPRKGASHPPLTDILDRHKP